MPKVTIYSSRNKTGLTDHSKLPKKQGGRKNLSEHNQDAILF